MGKYQLYTLTNENYRLPFAIDREGNVMTAPANHIPMLCWPNGRWCFEANIWMLQLYERNLSRRKGGSLKAYAGNISHLLRYCFEHQTDMINLTDGQFTVFIKNLQIEFHKRNPQVKARNANTIINIGRNCLDLLDCVGRFHHQPDFVSKEGRIRAERKEAHMRIEGREEKRIVKYWHHHSFPTPDSKVKVLPVNKHHIQQLYIAVNQISASFFLKQRRQTMLMMLEVTGGRCGEIAALTVNSVNAAKAMEAPLLELITLKRHGNHTRQIPISHPDLDQLINFIEKQRCLIIRRTLGTNQDHGYVFISETSGRPLEAQTLSQEIFTLVKQAGIHERVHAHMFRHRFITKLFVTLIEQHAFENVDTFRRALLDVESLKQKVQQWTGHTRLASLDLYINLAFEEASNFKKTYDIITLNRLVDSVRNQIAIIRDGVNSDRKINEMIEQFNQLLNSFECDLNLIIL